MKGLPVLLDHESCIIVYEKDVLSLILTVVNCPANLEKSDQMELVLDVEKRFLGVNISG